MTRIAIKNKSRTFKSNKYLSSTTNPIVGKTEPYDTSGYVGDITLYFENGKFNMFFLHDANTKPTGAGIHVIHSL
ncbi:hypothetical protein [Gelidibacter gilvus]|uniref:Uncharacterized protein n=1 Tax=Gelidibacter gilvus TaxID=59602 RepID=A0A4V1LMM1_9FLAO|nr:hypothetical protein [Gelidibacter gilvus]RXJ45753.1 hypothetical protein ESZ48_15280 [Gelidibacter gilvus]